MKIAFIGDSFSAYNQYGQEKNHWSYLLAKHFPQHTYYNYALGGRGYDYSRLAILDAKMKDVDVILINRTFNYRSFLHYGDKEEMFEVLEEVDNNYTTFAYNCHYWYSSHSDKIMCNAIPSAPPHVEKNIQKSLVEVSMSTAYQTYNANWFDNIDSLYNFKHIVKLELLDNPNHERMDNAYKQLKKAFGKEALIKRKENPHRKLENDLILSDEDDHWSPKANKWIFDNYILPKVVDILSQMRRG